MYGYIYLTINRINGKYYIGQHRAIRYSIKYKGSGKLLKNAISKYGENNFDTAMLMAIYNKKTVALSQLALDTAEVKFITQYRKENIPLYNIARGGKTGTPLKGTKEYNIFIANISKTFKGIPKTAEHNRKNSLANKGENCYWYGKTGTEHPATGRKHSAEAKEKNRIAHLGKSPSNKGIAMSDEQKKKLSIACMGQKNAKGAKHSAQSKKAQSEKMKGRYAGENNPMFGVHRFGVDSPHYGHHEPYKKNRLKGETIKWI